MNFTSKDSSTEEILQSEIFVLKDLLVFSKKNVTFSKLENLSSQLQEIQDKLEKNKQRQDSR